MLSRSKNISRYCITILLIGILILMPIPGLVSMGLAQTQGKCSEELTEAEQKYNSGRFDEAIDLIGKCLEKPGITEDEKKQAYRLLGLIYIAKDYLEEAKAAVRRLLELVPNYEVDTVQDPPTFTNLVEEVRDEIQAEPEPEPKPEPEEEQIPVQPPPEKKGSNTLLYVGAGALVVGAGAAAFLLLSGGDDNGGGNGAVSQFPLPPGRP